MKVVFLDIDGVVCTMRALWLVLCDYYGVEFDEENEKHIQKINKLKKHKKDKHPFISAKYWPFDTNAISNIYKLYRETNCKFVISSTWRVGRTIKELKDVFSLKGLRIDILDKTDSSWSPERGATDRGIEISQWLKLHPEVESYVILDDDSFDIKQYHPNNFIQTSFENGFTSIELEKAIKILNGVKK